MNDAVVIPSISPQQAWELSTGCLRDPFSILGPFDTDIGRIIRTFLPGAEAVEIVARAGGRHLGNLSKVQPDGLFMGKVESREPYRFRIKWPGAVQETEETPTALICC